MGYLEDAQQFLQTSAQGAGTSAAQGAVGAVQAAIPGLMQQAKDAIPGLVETARAEAQAVIPELAQQAGAAAGAGAKSSVLGNLTGTEIGLIAGGAALVLGILGYVALKPRGALACMNSASFNR